jgi:hypothetical protein
MNSHSKICEERRTFLEGKGYKDVVISEPMLAYKGSTAGEKARIELKHGEIAAIAMAYPKEQIDSIFRVQRKVPKAAQILDVLEFNSAEALAIISKAPGELLWEIDGVVRPSLEEIGKQLFEIVEQLKVAKLVHADLRPWNLYYDIKVGLTVIDWGFSFLIGEKKYSNTIEHLRARGHSKTREDEIDRIDASRTLRCLKNPDSLEEVWNHPTGTFTWRPQPWV